MSILAGCIALPEVDKLDKPRDIKPGEIEWRASFEEATKFARTKNRPMMLVFYGVSGKRLDERVFTARDVIELSQKFACLKIGTSQKDLIDKYKVQEFPTFIFADSQGGEYDRVSGYKSWQSFADILKAALIPVEVEYSMDMVSSQPGSANVECVFRNVRWESLFLGMIEKHDRISDISYDSTDGRPGWEEIDKNAWLVKFSTTRMKTLTVKYQVGLNIMSRFSLQPEYASYVGDDYGVLDGRALFLQPQDLHVMSKVKVHLVLPSGWLAITPWDAGDTPELFWSDSAAEVSDSVFCIGEFQFAKRLIGEHEIFAVHSGARERNPNLEYRVDQIIQIFKDYVTRFGDFPYKRYLAVFADQAPDGRHITGSSAHIVGFASPVNVDYSFVAHEIFHIWNGGVINQKSDYEGWFKEGFTQYYGYLTPYRVGLYGKERFLQYLNRDYEGYIERYKAGDDIALSRVKEETARKEGYLNPESIGLRTMYNKSALVAYIMDYEIRKRTAGVKSLDDIMYYMFRQFCERRYSTDDILKAFNTVTGQDFNQLFSDFVYGKTRLPSLQPLQYDIN